jgi:hypothetical protein
MRTQKLDVFRGALALAVTTLSFQFAQPMEAQTFTLDAPLLTARWLHTATLLPGGKVLVAGGRIANDFSTSQWANTNVCELYDPLVGASAATAAMADAHAAGSAVLLANGLVLVAGGEDNGFSTIAGAELYNPATGTWTRTGSLSQPREVAATVLLPNGKVLAAGGWDDNSGTNPATVEIYDPVSQVWSNAAALPYGADSMSATVLGDGTVLVAGGSEAGNLISNAMLYNPANNTWTATGPMTEPRAGHAATLLPNGEVLVVGGDSSAEVYNPTNHTWTLAAPMNTGRSTPSATLLPDGQVLVLGGDPWQTTAELYNPASNTWTYTGSLHVGRVYHTATLAASGQVVVAGGDAGTIGYYNGPALSAVETYDQSSQAVFGPALGAASLAWSTSGDTDWFIETTNTYNSTYAAQSGSVTNNESTTLSATVTGPGTVLFYWSSIANDTNGGFDLEFYVDDPNTGDQGDLNGNNGWAQAGPYTIPAGQHTINWTVSANGDTDPTEAGFVADLEYLANPSTNPAGPPVGWWKGDGNALDTMGANDGTLESNVTYAAGMLGEAFNFDGTGGWVQLPGVSANLPAGTISLWINLREWNWQAAGNGIFAWAGTEYSPNLGDWDGINLGNHQAYTTTGELMFGIFTSDWQWAHSGVVPQTNTWYHVAGTWEPGGEQIYVNGQLKGTNAYAGAAPSDTYYNLIGRSSWPDSQINGLVDDVRLYNRALSALEINSLAHPTNSPWLSIRQSGTNAIVSWPEAATSISLQSAPSLSPTNWTAVTNPISWSGNNYVVTNALGGSERFFRIHP